MLVSVRGFHDDSVTTIPANETDTIQTLKDELHERTGHPLETLRLIFSGKELDDNRKTLRELGIDETSTVIYILRAVEPLSSIRFVSVSLDGNSHDIAADVNSSVGELRAKYSEVSGVPKNCLKLVWGGEVLGDDSKTAGELGIKHNSTIHVVVILGSAAEIPSSYELAVGRTQSVEELKTQVQNLTGIITGEIRLRYGDHRLVNGTTLDNYSVTKGAVITFRRCRSQHYIQKLTAVSGSQIFIVECIPQHTLSAIRKGITAALSANSQDVVLNVNGTEVENYDVSLEQLGVIEDSTIKVSILAPGEEVERHAQEPTHESSPDDFVILDSDTTVEVQQRILVPLAESSDANQEGIETVSDSSPDSVLIIDHSPEIVEVVIYQLKIKDLRGPETSISIRSDALVQELKQIVHEATGNEPETQRLIYAGQELKEGHKLGEYGITDGGTVHFKHQSRDKLRTIEFKTVTGIKTNIEIEGSNTVNELKEKYAEATNVATAALKFILSGKELANGNSTADDLGLKHQSTVHVVVKQL
mmetsp:Transcript_32679/g.56815  ORF Transcript_32679/g.56815 Transcript_32679/m.56815 type:complete len:532 (+) Transcript_32679:2221-3816(+)